MELTSWSIISYVWTLVIKIRKQNHVDPDSQLQTEICFDLEIIYQKWRRRISEQEQQVFHNFCVDLNFGSCIIDRSSIESYICHPANYLTTSWMAITWFTWFCITLCITAWCITYFHLNCVAMTHHTSHTGISVVTSIAFCNV